MKHNTNSVFALNAEHLATLEAIIERNGSTRGASFYIVSGDDVYAVLPSDERFLYVKMLYGPEEGSSHFVSEYGFFDNQFHASQHACRQALEEEKGYAQD